jgi:hypothetical protein
MEVRVFVRPCRGCLGYDLEQVEVESLKAALNVVHGTRCDLVVVVIEAINGVCVTLSVGAEPPFSDGSCYIVGEQILELESLVAKLTAATARKRTFA